jgi:hypothetical protein
MNMRTPDTAGDASGEKPAKVNRRVLYAVRARAWSLARLQYAGLVAAIERDLASGWLRPDQIENWRPHDQVRDQGRVPD